MDKPTVIALGGNAISPPEVEGNIDQQFYYTRRTARHLAALVADGRQLVVTRTRSPS